MHQELLLIALAPLCATPAEPPFANIIVSVDQLGRRSRPTPMDSVSRWTMSQICNKDAAYELFQGILPQITYSLQNLKFSHHAEKALLVARGVLSGPEVRVATLTVHQADRAYVNFLNQKVLDLVRRIHSSARIIQ